MENKIFDSFHVASRAQCEAIQIDQTKSFVDQRIEDNYTLIARPSEELIHRIVAFQKELQSIDSQHYYYSPDRLHMTIVGGISPNKDGVRMISQLSFIFDHLQIRCSAWGCASNTSAASWSLYPVDFSFHELREQIRSVIDERGTDYTIWLPEYEYVGWINYVRYQSRPQKELLDKIRTNLESELGMFQFDTFELVKTSGLVLNPSWTTSLHVWKNI